MFLLQSPLAVASQSGSAQSASHGNQQTTPHEGPEHERQELHSEGGSQLVPSHHVHQLHLSPLSPGALAPGPGGRGAGEGLSGDVLPEEQLTVPA